MIYQASNLHPDFVGAQFLLGLIYDLETFEQVGEFNYSTEGWGITHNGERLMIGAGTKTLDCLDPEIFEEIGPVQVK